MQVYVFQGGGGGRDWSGNKEVNEAMCMQLSNSQSSAEFSSLDFVILVPWWDSEGQFSNKNCSVEPYGLNKLPSGDTTERYGRELNTYFNHSFFLFY